jgi:hypothetical protein
VNEAEADTLDPAAIEMTASDGRSVGEIADHEEIVIVIRQFVAVGTACALRRELRESAFGPAA